MAQEKTKVVKPVETAIFNGREIPLTLKGIPNKKYLTKKEIIELQTHLDEIENKHTEATRADFEKFFKSRKF